MNKLTSFLAVLFLAYIMMCTSCKKEGLMTYDTENSIYFYNQLQLESFADSSTDITFAYMDAGDKDSVIKVALRVTGIPAANDRKFKIVADTTSTAVAGVHYEKLPEFFIMPAKSIDDTISVRLLRADDLKNKRITLVLRLQPTSELSTNLAILDNYSDGRPISYLTYRLSFSDVLDSPLGWSTLFGMFSVKKMQLICELGGVTASWFNTGDDDNPLYSRQFNQRCSYFAQLLRNYLLQQETAGTPVYYEDGVTPMATND